MEKILSYPLTIIFYLVFLLLLVIFHPIQWLCLNVFGYQAHKKSVDILNAGLTRCLHILGTTIAFNGMEKVPVGVPLIIVANHQSMYDIPPIIWFMRKVHPKFISKKELGKGIPSVSYNLRHGGSVLIDRKDSRQALPAIKSLAEYIEKYNRSAVIFPEGTRSRDGIPKKFSENGLKILCKNAPSAYIVPISISNSWKIVRFGQYPLGLGSRLTFTIQEPFAIKNIPFEEVITRTENAVIQGIKN
ncbi:lysophospholipid acyltransferase family protein [Flavobacterium subsaxonicum]|uniref:Glycerol acyltransferase n=1 Tax=Flavobacterium subsaxonicum WB 4.1-42 = DSM 21790 TaxID=1121898 RepID=A0A0A2MGH0_9FLAO|nr:lysophospholipid acyltransferase family protein [Flavobacterium subsaxonicum]KGO91394.1 glycerol acyltransferase [Flavobacterium subsaxonicum WB 4.1-42 = DSM 21790]